MEHNLDHDIMANAAIVSKIRSREDYAQNLYAAMCNMRWQKIDVMPILKEEYWSCSWRSSGGIVASIRGHGESYMDWYCSGMMGGLSYDTEEDERFMAEKKFVPEGTVTDEIKQDLAGLGWHSSPWPKD